MWDASYLDESVSDSWKMLVAQAANHMSAQRCYLQKTLLNHMMQGSGIDMARHMSWTSF